MPLEYSTRASTLAVQPPSFGGPALLLSSMYAPTMSGQDLTPSRYPMEGNQHFQSYPGASQSEFAAARMPTASQAPGSFAAADQPIAFGGMMNSSTTQRPSVSAMRGYNHGTQPRAGASSSSARARDAYATRIPDSRRRSQHASEWPTGNTRAVPASAVPYLYVAPGRDMQPPAEWVSDDGPDQPPKFEQDQTFFPLQTRDGTRVVPNINADAYKGFARPLDNSAFYTYRRNYLLLKASFSLDGLPHDGSTVFLSHGSAGMLPVRGWGLRLAARAQQTSTTAERPRSAKKIGLVQFTAKRDKGDKDEIMITEISPMRSGPYPQTQGYQAAAGRPGYHPSAVVPLPLKQYRPDTGEETSAIVSTTRTPTGDSLTFERMQFTCATGNNRQAGGAPSRNQQQQFFQIVVELYADIETNPTVKGNWIKVCQSASEALIVRGRSPSHYKAHDEAVRRAYWAKVAAAEEAQRRAASFSSAPATGPAAHTSASAVGYSYPGAESQSGHSAAAQFSLPQMQLRPPPVSQEFAGQANYAAMDPHANHTASDPYQSLPAVSQPLASMASMAPMTSTAQQMDGHNHHAGNYPFAGFTAPAYISNMPSTHERAETGHMSHQSSFNPRASYQAHESYPMGSEVQHVHPVSSGSYQEQPSNHQAMVTHNHHHSHGQLSGGPVAPAMPTPPTEDRGSGSYGYNPGPLAQDMPAMSLGEESRLMAFAKMGPIPQSHRGSVAESSKGYYEYPSSGQKRQVRRDVAHDQMAAH